MYVCGLKFGAALTLPVVLAMMMVKMSIVNATSGGARGVHPECYSLGRSSWDTKDEATHHGTSTDMITTITLPPTAQGEIRSTAQIHVCALRLSRFGTFTRLCRLGGTAREIGSLEKLHHMNRALLAVCRRGLGPRRCDHAL